MLENLALDQQGVIDMKSLVTTWPLQFVRAWAAFRCEFIDGLRKDAEEDRAENDRAEEEARLTRGEPDS